MSVRVAPKKWVGTKKYFKLFSVTHFEKESEFSLKPKKHPKQAHFGHFLVWVKIHSLFQNELQKRV